MYRVKDKLRFEFRQSGSRACACLRHCLRALQICGKFSNRRSKALILQLRKQRFHRGCKPCPRSTLKCGWAGPRVGVLWIRAGKRRGRRRGLSAPGSTALPHLALSAKRPIFPFREWVLLGGSGGGGGLRKPPGLLHSRDSLREPLSGRNVRPAAPSGAGPPCVPQTSLLCALRSGPLPAGLPSIFQGFQAGSLKEEAIGKCPGLGRGTGP